MLYEFLLVSPKNSDSEKICTELSRNKLYRINTVDKAADVLAKLKEARIHCLVFNLDKFTADKTAFASQIRDLGYGFPIIIFATYLQKNALEALKKVKKVVLIEKPFESKDIWGIAQKMVQGDQVPQRIHRRFYTNQKLQLQNAMSGDNYLGKMYNLSRGGAYVEVDNAQFAAGDIIKITIPLDKVSKSYSLDAEVVWYTQRGFWKGAPAIGVRFVKPDDIYRNLLDKL